MTLQAAQIQYRDEFIAGFEQRRSLLSMSVTTEAQIKGNQGTFLVADSGPNATAVTRGVDGQIPARVDNLDQYTATLVEWHDLVRRTRFNIFAQQGDGMAIMQQTTMGTINRKIDQDIIDALAAGATQTLNSAAPAPFTFEDVGKINAILTQQSVPADGQRTAVISAAMHAYMAGWAEFSNADYVSMRPIENGSGLWDDQPMLINWYGWKWIVHPKLSLGTNAEVAYFYHKSSIGHCVDVGGIDTAIGYDDEQDYSYARTSVFMGSKTLDVNGIVKYFHDGSAMTTS